jgi:uncharacterized cupredoxin-like copper-binding protein
MRGFALVFACFLSVGAGVADEVAAAFETRVVKLDVMPGETDAPLVWSCTNRWEIPLVVERFEESCGCLSGGADSVAIAPGESGEIRAKFTPGPYRGVVRKSLHVRFVGHEKPVELVAEVTIPSTVECSTRDLVWITDQFAPETIEVKAGTEADFQITGLVGVSEEQFTIDKQVVTEGRHYRLVVTPRPGAGVGTKCLQVRTDSPDPRDQVIGVFLRIEKPSAAESSEPDS